MERIGLYTHNLFNVLLPTANCACLTNKKSGDKRVLREEVEGGGVVLTQAPL